MTDYLSFEGEIEPLEWGRATYTILRLPPEIAKSLESGNGRRVEGEINDHPINLALTQAPAVEGTFLWTGKSLLNRIGISPGDTVEVRLRPADPDEVETPGDVQDALRGAEVTEAWNALTPGKQRSYLHQISTAKRAETRAKRIASLVAALTEG